MRFGEASGPPVKVACYSEEGGADNHADEGGVDEDGDGEGEADHLDDEEVAEGEGGEDGDHDGGGAGDKAGGACKAFGDGIIFGEAGFAGFADAGYEEDFVVHAKAEDDREGDDRDEGEDAAGGGGDVEQMDAVTILKDPDEGAEGGHDGEEVEGDRFDRGDEGAEADEEGEERAADDKGGDVGEAADDDGLVVGVEGGDAADEEFGAWDAGEFFGADIAELADPVDLLAEGDVACGEDFEEGGTAVGAEEGAAGFAGHFVEVGLIAVGDGGDGDDALAAGVRG